MKLNSCQVDKIAKKEICYYLNNKKRGDSNFLVCLSLLIWQPQSRK